MNHMLDLIKFYRAACHGHPYNLDYLLDSARQWSVCLEAAMIVTWHKHAVHVVCSMETLTTSYLESNQ